MSNQKEENTSSSADTDEPLHEYAGGDITERTGRVNMWLWPVYIILFAWSIYYLYTYWGGLGPGLDY